MVGGGEAFMFAIKSNFFTPGLFLSFSFYFLLLLLLFLHIVNDLDRHPSSQNGWSQSFLVTGHKFLAQYSIYSMKLFK